MLKLFTMKNCGPCAALKQYMNAKCVEYQELPVEEHFEEARALGMSYAPTLVFPDGSTVTGFGNASKDKLNDYCKEV